MGYTTGKRRRPKYKKPKDGGGKKISVYLSGKSLDMARKVENLSGFVRLALEQAPGVMAWALLKERRPDQYYDTVKLEDVLDEYNATHPLDPLTKARQEKAKWQPNSQKQRELW